MPSCSAWHVPQPDFPGFCHKTQNIRMISANGAGDVATILAALAT
jgi:hypothetical protein